MFTDKINLAKELEAGRSAIIGHKTENEIDQNDKVITSVSINYVDDKPNPEIEKHIELFEKQNKNVDISSDNDSLEIAPPSSDKTKEEIIENVLNVIYKKIKCQVVAIFLLDPKDGILRRAGIKGTDLYGNSIDKSWLSDESYEIGTGFTGRAAIPTPESKYGKTQFFDDFKDENLKYKSDFNQLLGEIRDAVAIPLNGRNKTYGVLRVINKRIDNDFIGKLIKIFKKDKFNDIDIASISFFAGVTSAAISNYHRDVQSEFLKFLKDSLIRVNSKNFEYDLFYKEVLKYLIGSETAIKACILRVKDDKDQSMVVKRLLSVDGIKFNKDNKHRRFNQGFVGLAVTTRTSQIIQKITKSGKIDKFINSDWVREYKFEAFGCFPIIVSETQEVVGTISLKTYFYGELVAIMKRKI